jgi:hypothetical protein
VFVETGAGSVGWRRLVAVCAACANSRPGMSLAEFARLLGGTPVAEDETSRPYDPVRPFDLGGGGSSPTPDRQPEPAASAPEDADQEAMVPLLTAEVALLQARLDEVQRQLDRLTQP